MTPRDAVRVSPVASFTPDARPSATMTSATSAPVRTSPRCSRIRASKAATALPGTAFHDRRPRGLEREGDDPTDLPGEGVFRSEPGVQYRGAKSARTSSDS